MSKRKGLLLPVILFMGCAQVPLAINHLDSSHQQAVYVKYKNSSKAKLSFWEYQGNKWTLQGNYRAVVGRSGVAKDGAKKEGDGYTPSGVYVLGPSFGYNKSLSTKLRYIQVTDDDFWVDDVQSPSYNTWVKGKPNAKSYEVLKRKDNLYKMAMVIDYNAHPIVPGKGSAIFLHIWRNYHHPTSGCVAISERNMDRLIKKLDDEKKPVIIIER